MDTTQNLSQTLSEIGSQTLQNPAGFAGLALFPLFHTPILSGQYYLFGAGSTLEAPANIKRAPGSSFSRSHTKRSNDNYNCEHHGHEEPIGYSENAKYAKPGASQAAAAVRSTMVLLLNHENRCQKAATDPSVPTAAVTIPWADPVAVADIITDIQSARQAVFDATALEANVITLPRAVYEIVKKNRSIREHIKLSDSDARWPELLAALFDVDRLVVARALVNNGKEGAINVSEIWGSLVVIAHVDTSEDFKAPSFGRTFIVTDDQSPLGISIESYNQESISSLIVRASQATSEKLTGPSCGFTLTGTLG